MKKILNFLVFLISLPIVSANGEDCFMGEMMIGNYGFGMMGFGWLISLLIVIVLVLLIIWLIKQIQKK